MSTKLYKILNKLTPDDANHYVEQRKLLWTNARPISSFAAQTISVSGMSEYDAIAIIPSGGAPGSEVRLAKDSPFEVKAHIISILGISDNTSQLGGRVREVYGDFTANTVRFSDCYDKYAGSTTYSFFNERNIPYKIYGIKKLGS